MRDVFSTMARRKKQRAEKAREVTHLTWHEVELVRSLREGGMAYSKIAEKMEIGKATAVDICMFRIRRHA